MTRQSIPRLRKITWRLYFSGGRKQRDLVAIYAPEEFRNQVHADLIAKGAKIAVFTRRLSWPTHGDDAITWIIKWPDSGNA